MKPSILQTTLVVILVMICTPLMRGQEFQSSLVLSGAGNIEIRKSVLDNDGNLICAGVLSGTADFDPGSGVVNKTSVGSLDIFFAKYNPDGALLFVVSVGGSGTDFAHSCAVDENGDIIIVVRAAGVLDYNPGAAVNTAYSGIVLAKYTSNGEFLWVKRINNALWNNELAIAANNDIVLTGMCVNSNDLDPSANSAIVVMPDQVAGIFVARYSSAGDYILHKYVYGTQGTTPGSVVVDHDDNIIFTGNFIGVMDINTGSAVNNRTAQNQDMFLIKLSPTGDFLWGNTYGGVTGDWAKGLAFDSENNIYLTGKIHNTTDFDPSPAVHTYGGACPTLGNAFLVKYNSSGAFLWIRDFHHNARGDISKDVAVDANDNVYIVGYFKPSLNLNAVTVGMVLSYYTLIYGILGEDIFVVKFASNGDYLCHRVIANYVEDVIVNDANITAEGPLRLAVGDDNRIYVSGGFQSDIDFDPYNEVGEYTSVGMDGFISVYTQLDPECNIPGNNGCVDEEACNYNPHAFTSDGSCSYDCSGCTDPSAVNYSTDAVVDDGSCDYDMDMDGVSVGQGDCNDNANAIHPGATEVCNGVDEDCDAVIDEGAGQIYYADNDNDGYGNAGSTTLSCTTLVGYVSNALDCNDNNVNIRPGATELCDNIDNNCDGIIDNNCSSVANDFRTNAITLAVANYNSCTTTSGTLIGSTVSSESTTSVITGQDVWYKFIAPAPGIRLRVTTYQVNVLIELQSENGSLVDSENIRPGVGNEILNYGGLTSGSTYYVAVRNVNSAQGNGTFTICASRMNSTAITTPTFSLTSCNSISTTSVSAQSYTFNFTSTTTGQTFTKTQNSTNCLLMNVLNLPIGESFNVQVNAQYSMVNGMNSFDLITVNGSVTGPVNTSHPAVFVASSQQCPTTVLINRNINTNVYLCNVSNYQWSVQPANLALPSFEISTGTSRLLMLSTANGFQQGQSYSIKIRVTYTNGYTTPWGQTACVSISTSAGSMMEDETWIENERGESDFDESEIQNGDEESIPSITGDINRNETSLSVYPNPMDATNVRIQCSGLEDGEALFQMIDMMGKVCENKTIVVADRNYFGEFDPGLFSSGVYLIRISQGHHSVEELVIKR